ncbi:MAG: aldehyde dehydrogenase family protein, partial [Verrucomicrobia bacterium]|nr:aldehyde dehydrogenase family protein [Verrucomicrobiota bacterium]
MDLQNQPAEIFRQLDLTGEEPGAFARSWFGSGRKFEKCTPIDGSLLGTVRQASPENCDRAISAATEAAAAWRLVPAPQRGELVRRLGQKLRELKPVLGRLVALEAGKILAEGEGEVQEMIDICEFATGLSRQLYGLTIASERPAHRMYEQWHPLGVVAIISAFNFPVAVWSWNAALAIICGNATIWKPSEKTPFSALACIKIAAAICDDMGVDSALFSLLIGGATIGGHLVADRRVALVSATGSVRMGKQVAETVSRRLGKTLLELGGNNAVIVTPSANLEMARRALVFGAVGTAGQRCTTTRRLILHRAIYEPFLGSLVQVYTQLRIGNPLLPETLVGPLIDSAAVEHMQATLEIVKALGGEVRYGGEWLTG